MASYYFYNNYYYFSSTNYFMFILGCVIGLIVKYTTTRESISSTDIRQKVTNLTKIIYVHWKNRNFTYVYSNDLNACPDSTLSNAELQKV